MMCFQPGQLLFTMGEPGNMAIFCEKYSFINQDDLGIWTSPAGSRVAWFKDPDGNVLSLTE